MATSDILCGLCNSQDIKKRADHWCPDCEEGLCSECFRYHKISKASKNHQVMTVENFKKLPKTIASIGHHCEEHDKFYQNYCPTHESLCCPVCIATDHSKCVDLLVIDDFITKAKSSSPIESIEENIECMERNLHLLLKKNGQNVVKNKTHRANFLDNIKRFRESINTHFDKLEQQILQELSVVEEQIKTQNDSLSQELEKKLRSVEELKQEVVAVKKYASDIQTCLGGMSLKRKVDTEKQYIKSLVKDGKSKQSFLKCSLDDKILSVILSTTHIGSVSTEDLPITIDPETESENPLDKVKVTSSSELSIREINLAFKCKFELPVGNLPYNISGCAFQSDGSIVLVDRQINNLLIFSEIGELKKVINFSTFDPIDVTSVNGNTICVSCCDSNRLQLIDTDSYETLQIIQTSNNCCGVTSENGTLFWYEDYKGIQIKQQSTEDITTLVKANDGGYWSYVSARANKIYQTNEEQKTVSCFKLNGDKIWEFKDESKISYPIGLAIDNASNVYVADPSRGIFVVSPDGKDCRKILGVDDGISNPYALCFERDRNLLLVSNYNGPVFIYSIT